MIFFVDNEGTIIKQLPSPVYQGASGANNIILIAPFAASLSFSVAFTLPNGVRTERYMMTHGGAVGEGVEYDGTPQSIWTFSMPNNITQWAGAVYAQFFAYATDGSLVATSRTSFTVQPGVAEELPDEPTQDVYNEILTVLSQLQSSLNSGTYAARAIYWWIETYTYGMNEITFCKIGTYGALVRSVTTDNTGNEPYDSDGNNNSEYWQELVNFNDIMQALEDAVTAAEEAAQSEENAKASEEAAAQSETNAAQSEANAKASEENAAGSAEAAAESAKNAAISESNAAVSESNAAKSAQEATEAAAAAEDLAINLGRTAKFVDELPEVGNEEYMYILVSDESSNLFELYIYNDGEWEQLGAANISFNNCKPYQCVLYASGWTGNRQTITISGVTADDTVSAAAGVGYGMVYTNCGVRAVSIVDNGVLFMCNETPTENISVDIIVTHEQEISPTEGYYTETEADALLAAKQNITDNSLETTAKTVVGAINENKVAIDGLREDVIAQDHFKGFVNTAGEVEDISADLNDFAYCIGTGTIWIYGSSGWYDTHKAYPSDATPLSTTTPIMDGVAAVGSSSSAARADHIHPTDTSRASAAALQTEAEERTAADAELNTKITAEETARESADDNLQSAIDNEVNVRSDEDKALQDSVSAEATRAQSAETALNEAIETEAATRAAADEALQAAIDAAIVTGGAKVINEQITIAASAWSSSTASATVSGVTSASIVMASAANGSGKSVAECNIRVTGQSADTVTFTCNTVPSSAVNIDLLAINT